MSIVFIFVSMQNSDKVLEEFRVRLHFLIAQYFHNFYFKIIRSSARHLAATVVTNSVQYQHLYMREWYFLLSKEPFLSEVKK